MNTTKINKHMHQGLQLKSVIELFHVSIEDLARGINRKTADVVQLISSSEIDDSVLNQIAIFLDVPLDVVKNFKYDLPFQPNILSENNTIINYNHTINQNSVENLAKAYEAINEIIVKNKK